MNLRKLQIERQRWGKDEGKCTGKIEFENETGAVSVFLSPAKCDELFKIIADGIEETAKQCAEELRCNVIEHRAALAGSQLPHNTQAHAPSEARSK